MKANTAFEGDSHCAGFRHGPDAPAKSDRPHIFRIYTKMSREKFEAPIDVLAYRVNFVILIFDTLATFERMPADPIDEVIVMIVLRLPPKAVNGRNIKIEILRQLIQ